MSGMEVVAVLGCVAAIVSAYKDGGNIVQQIKAKRRARNAPPPPTMLETSLRRGPAAVEEAKDDGIERYGPQFAIGDRIACDALKDILINLQATLLKNLMAAQSDDNHTDFNGLIDTSNRGRLQCVTTLAELYMRLDQAAPLQQVPLAPRRVETLDSIESPGSSWNGEHSQSPWIQDQSLTSSPPQSSSAQPLSVQTSLTPRVSAQPPHLDKSVKSNRSRWLYTSKSRKDFASPRPDHPSLSTTTSEQTINDSFQRNQIEGKVQSTWNRPPQDLAASRNLSGVQSESVDHSSVWQSQDPFVSEDNPWEGEVSISQRAADTFAQKSEQKKPLRRLTETTLADNFVVHKHDPKPYALEKQVSLDSIPLPGDGRSPYEPRPPRMKKPSWPRGRSSGEGSCGKDDLSSSTKPSQKSRISPVMARSSSSQSSPPTPSLDAKNSYNGFCVGAYKMQVGFEQESLKLKNASISMGGEMHYWACFNKHCVFEGQAWKSGRSWSISNIVRTHNGVQYRWRFLAKSHVAMSRTSNRAFDYQCIFCLAQGGSTNVYRTESAFIEHVSTHRGQRSELKDSDKFCCIDDRVASAEEEFDINLTPPLTTLSGDGSLQGQSLVASTESDTHSTDRDFPRTQPGAYLGVNV